MDTETATSIIATEYPTSFSLAGTANCGSPDSQDSPGANFLRSVADSTAEAVDWTIAERDGFDSIEPADLAHEIADESVPIYTHTLWAVFVDLAAYNEQPDELCFDGSDMEQGARVCLYMIAERLVAELLDTLAETLPEQD